jgi:hypothetical protein
MRKASVLRIYLIGVLLILSLAGCSSNAPSPTVVPSPQPTETPVPDLKGVVNESTGAVKMVLRFADDQAPVRQQTVFLAHLLPIKGGDLEGGFVPALDATTAPRGETNDNGEVTIPLVEPGRYILIILTPMSPIVLAAPDREKELLVEIVAGEMADLGEVHVFVDPKYLQP